MMLDLTRNSLFQVDVSLVQQYQDLITCNFFFYQNWICREPISICYISFCLVLMILPLIILSEYLVDKSMKLQTNWVLIITNQLFIFWIKQSLLNFCFRYLYQKTNQKIPFQNCFGSFLGLWKNVGVNLWAQNSMVFFCMVVHLHWIQHSFNF